MKKNESAVTRSRGTPRGMRLHIGLFGRRNAGKSSLLNAFTRQEVSIVSAQAGTTTDPVEKPMELLPLGPVQFIDTAGIDDVGVLGAQRVARTRKIFDRTDLAILVAEAPVWGTFEEEILAEFARRETPLVVAFHKADQNHPPPELVKRLRGQRVQVVETSAVSGTGLVELRSALIATAPDDFINTPAIVGDLLNPGQPVVLVVPIDKEAPKGRLILPQVQAIRDILDHDGWCLVVKEHELRAALEQLRMPPALVVTDSQAFEKVAADTPSQVPLTSFSILFARFKGDLQEYVRGALAMERLRAGDAVLVAEACSHHPIGEDIGRVKIPRWLAQYVGGRLKFSHVQGHDFPDDLSPYRMVIQCGSCMINRREVLSRIWRCRQAGVPVTNYGLAIARALGILERALAPFPSALSLLKQDNEPQRRKVRKET